MVNLGALNPFGSTVSASSTIVELRVYPVKSCRGISITSTNLTTSGLDLDRRWMFVDTSQNNQFQTIRQISKMTLINTAFSSPSNPSNTEFRGDEDDLELVLSISGQPEKRISVPARPSEEWLEEHTNLEQVEIWGSPTDGRVYHAEFNKIFAEFVGKPLALVYKGPTARIASGNGAPQHLGREAVINFPDMMPLLVANKCSIAELNSRLKAKGQTEITIERFRPNVILEGGEAAGMAAWTEDSWKTLRLVNGETTQGWLSSGPSSTIDIDVSMRCARCQVPNVEPSTGEKHKKEPWDTLVSYRRIDEGIKYKPCFGMLCAPRSEGPIAVGMTMEVTETTSEHRFLKDG